MRAVVLTLLVAARFNVGCDCTGLSVPATSASVEWSSPADGSTVDNARAFAVSGTCSHSGQPVELSGAASASIDCAEGRWAATLDVSAAPAGTVTLEAHHSSPYGSVAPAAKRSFIKPAVVPSMPMVSITAPAADSLVTAANVSTFTISGTCSENNQTVTLAGIPSAAISGPVPCVNGLWSAQLNLSTAADGPITVTADHQATDGNQAPQASRTFLKDTLGPQLAITGPAIDTWAHASSAAPVTTHFTTFKVIGSCDDATASVNVMVANSTVGGAVSCAGGAFQLDLNLTPIAEGAFTVEATSTDTAGNVATPATRAFRKDTLPPVVVITVPSPGDLVTVLNAATFTVSGTCSENGSTLAISGAATGTASCSGGMWSTRLNLSALPDAMHTLTVVATDLAGNVSTSTRVTVNKVTNAPTVSISSPAIGAFITPANAASFMVSGSCSENGQAVTLTPAATGAITCTNNAWSAQLDLSSAAEGTVTVTANHSSAQSMAAAPFSRDFTKDTVAPVLTFTSPAANAWAHGNGAAPAATYFTTFRVSGTCDANVNIRVAGQPTLVMTSVPCTNNAFQANLNLTPIVDGAFSVEVNATDAAGNQAAQVSRLFGKDIAPPAVNLVTINGGQTWLTGTAQTLTFTASDVTSGLLPPLSFERSLDSGGSWGPIPVTALTNVSAQWTPGAGDISTQSRVRMIARDVAGNTAIDTSEADFTVAAPPANLSWSPLAYDFGVNAFAYGKTGSVSFTLSNTGPGAATGCSAPVLTGANPGEFEISIDGCGTANVNSMSNCVVNVRTNLSSLGAKTATLSRTCSFGGTIVTTANQIRATGIATSTRLFAMSNTNGDLGLATTNLHTAPYEVRFTNSGTAVAVGCTAPTLSSPDFELLGHDCGPTIGINQFCTARVRGRPTSVGQKQAPLNFSCSNAGPVGQLLLVDSKGTALPTHVAMTASGLVVRMSDGTVRMSGMWGGNNTLAEMTGYTNATQVSGGQGSFCAVQAAGTIRCAGTNSSGQLGNGGNTDAVPGPVTVSGISTATQVAVATMGAHACARLSNGTVRCWGANAQGQLGNNSNTDTNTPVNVSGISTATMVAAGGEISCAVLADGTVRCWGSNWFGALGDGSGTNHATPVQVKTDAVTPLTNIASVSIGLFNVCAVSNGGQVYCWGNNDRGQIGDGTLVSREYATPVTGLTTGVRAMVGYLSTCAALADGTARCWGENGLGSLGNGSLVDSSTPVPVTGLTGLAGGALTGANNGSATCSLLSNSSIKCWGAMGAHRANTSDEDTKLPTTVTQVSGLTEIATGDTGNCGVRTDGTVICWGHSGGAGEMALADSQEYATIPTVVPGLTDVKTISAGGQVMCALLNSGGVRCWGYGADGQRGDGSTAFTQAITNVVGITTATQLSGSDHSCVRLADGTSRCWGRNTSGQLGNGGNTDSSTPVTVLGLTGILGIYVASGQHTCAIMGDRSVRCWGLNDYGQLGDGTLIAKTTPTPVAGLTGAQSLALGRQHSCALLVDGSMRCWGRNYDGEFGDTTDIDSLVPVNTAWFSNFTSIAVGTGNGWSCGVSGDGTARCWGYGYQHTNLGNGVGSALRDPLDACVAGVNDASRISVRGHGCVVTTGGQAKCWGWEPTGLVDLTISDVSGFIP